MPDDLKSGTGFVLGFEKALVLNRKFEYVSGRPQE